MYEYTDADYFPPCQPWHAQHANCQSHAASNVDLFATIDEHPWSHTQEIIRRSLAASQDDWAALLEFPPQPPVTVPERMSPSLFDNWSPLSSIDEANGGSPSMTFANEQMSYYVDDDSASASADVYSNAEVLSPPVMHPWPPNVCGLNPNESTARSISRRSRCALRSGRPRQRSVDLTWNGQTQEHDGEWMTVMTRMIW